MDALPQDVASLVDHWRELRPDHEAVRFGDRSWTWQEFGDRVERNAAGQRALGLRPGDRVAYLDKNHPACLETSMACLRVGTANAVVNFRLAPDEIRYVINDAQAQVVFVGTEFLPVLAKIRDDLPTVRRVIVVGGDQDEYEQWLAGVERLRDTGSQDPNACFLQLYTSGTTGFPKGAMLTNASLSAHSTASANVTDIDADSVSMVAMPLFHVGGSAWAIVGMFHGARILVVRDIDPVSLVDDLVRQRVTHAFLVPAVFGFLLQVPGVADHDYSHVRALIYGASPMPLPLLRRSMDAFGADPFYQVYGMTEASGGVTMLGPEEHQDPSHEHRLMSAGKPMGGVEIAIVDPISGEPLGPDQVGEVWVRTKQIMAGYWHKPEADQAALAEDGWLRSGDAGHLDADGYLYISDRIKDMIISGGENIYPAEIERVLAEYPDVADVAVIGVPDDTWGEVGKAIVVPKPDTSFDGDALLAYCKEHLASFKCPKSVQVVAELPRNATGKVLKRQLREPFWASKETAI
ncbi:MAG TPA: long-chain-fatty-acid--CoA ligase [Pseudonocardiaceae bacterium]|jgi:acyl-CoA synthetase (AMP-forming)/AMP-acid ligase II|nr:long-chain-fatty-acid--CoA ligase [Pseudonocardiaceae bacterium]